MADETATTLHRAEDLVTLKQAAAVLGLPYFKLQRAARVGLIQTYTLYNSRKYVRVGEVLKAMATHSGVAQ